MLLGLLVKTFLPEGEPLVIGLDEALEEEDRRQGDLPGSGTLQPRPLREGQRLAVGVHDAPRANPVGREGFWALSFLGVLAPSERYAEEHGKRHKKLTDWTRQSLLLVRRWWPEREIVAVADSGYAAIMLLDRLARLSKPIAMVTCPRLDAALHEPAPPRRAGQR